MKLGIKKGSIGALVIAAIIYVAVSFVGQQESPNNSGFKDKAFQSEMVHVGWHKYDSWCVYFCKLVWHNSIENDTIRETAMTLISGNSQSTLLHFKKDNSGYFVVNDSASNGSIVIWQQYKDGKGLWSGHAGIVIEKHPNYFLTVEGNTNNAGGREGYIVAKKTRKYTRNVQNGLRLRKFIAIRNAS